MCLLLVPDTILAEHTLFKDVSILFIVPFLCCFQHFLRFISLMRYVPENRKIMVISEDADNVMIFDEKFRVHTQVLGTLFINFFCTLKTFTLSLNYFIKLLWI